MWIVKDSCERLQVLPAGWEARDGPEGATVYVNTTGTDSKGKGAAAPQVEHPLDDYYRFGASLLRRKALRTGDGEATSDVDGDGSGGSGVASAAAEAEIKSGMHAITRA